MYMALLCIYMPLLYMHLKKPKQFIIWNGWSSTYPRFDYHSHPKANTRSYACLLSCNKSNLLKPLAFKTQRYPSFNYHPKAKCISKSFQNPLPILIFFGKIEKIVVTPQPLEAYSNCVDGPCGTSGVCGWCV